MLIGATAVQAAAAQNPSSREWNARRAELFASLCPATAPRFQRFASVAKQSGFRESRPGLFGYRNTEIFVSLHRDGMRCTCWFTFGTGNPKLAASLIIGAMLKKYEGRFAADEDPRSIGTLDTTDGKLKVRVRKWKEFGGNWIGAEVQGMKRCPA